MALTSAALICGESLSLLADTSDKVRGGTSGMIHFAQGGNGDQTQETRVAKRCEM